LSRQAPNDGELSRQAPNDGESSARSAARGGGAILTSVGGTPGPLRHLASWWGE
jgi:hypothetical protein